MHHTPKNLLTVGAATALLLGAAACGGTKESRTGGAASDAEFNAASEKVVNKGEDKGGELKFALSASPDHLDPARGYYGWVWNTMRLYHRTLVGYPATPGTEGTKLVGDLATEVPTSPDGGQTWTYKLKDGIKFEDGTPITSKDVKYGVERTFASDVLDGGPGYLKEVLDDPKKPYRGPYKDTDPDKLGLASVETPDDKTITFKLNKKFQDFPYITAMPFSGPVPKAKDTGAKYDLKPVSSGPYKIETYSPDKEIVFTRNTNWDQASDTIRTALPDKITVRLKLNQNEIDNQLLNGTLDLDLASAGVGPQAQQQILSAPDKKKNADTPVSGFIRYVSIQSTVPPFDNIHCRKAIHYATDKIALQDLAGGAVAGGDIASTFLPPNIADHTDFNLYPTPGHRGDIEKAKDELKQCGKPDGFKTVVVARSERPKEVKQAESLQEQLKKIGVTVEVRKFPAGDYTATVVGVPATVKKQGYGLAMFGWGADYQTAFGFLSEIVDGRKIKPQGNYNVAELNDPAINKLIDDALAEPDAGKRSEMWKQIDRKTMESATIMPMVYEKALNYRNPRLSNVFIHPAFGMYDFQAIGVKK